MDHTKNHIMDIITNQNIDNDMDPFNDYIIDHNMDDIIVFYS